MLGELLAESSGKMTGLRVFQYDGTDTKFEVSFQGRGKLLGVEMTDMGSYLQTPQPEGLGYGEGTLVMITDDGEMITYTGSGYSTRTGPGFAASYTAVGTFRKVSPKFGRLNGVASVAEYDTNEAGDYTWKMWEWKSRARSD